MILIDDFVYEEDVWVWFNLRYQLCKLERGVRHEVIVFRDFLDEPATYYDELVSFDYYHYCRVAFTLLIFFRLALRF